MFDIHCCWLFFRLPIFDATTDDVAFFLLSFDLFSGLFFIGFHCLEHLFGYLLRHFFALRFIAAAFVIASVLSIIFTIVTGVIAILVGMFLAIFPFISW